MKKMNKKGFTMAELLIVVAIIAVLVAIAIPIFTTQLEKSREAVDAANIRAAYAEVMSEALTGDTVTARTINLKQQKDGWTVTPELPENIEIDSSAATPKASGTAVVNYNATSSKATLKFQ